MAPSQAWTPPKVSLKPQLSSSARLSANSIILSYHTSSPSVVFSTDPGACGDLGVLGCHVWVLCWQLFRAAKTSLILSRSPTWFSTRLHILPFQVALSHSPRIGRSHSSVQGPGAECTIRAELPEPELCSFVPASFVRCSLCMA